MLQNHYVERKTVFMRNDDTRAPSRFHNPIAPLLPEV